MTSRITTLAALLALLACPAVLAANKKAPSKDIPWVKDHKQALKDAKKGKKPIAICFIQRKCKLSMQMVKGLYKDGRIEDLKTKLVWLCVDPGRKDDFKWFLSLCGDNVEGTPTFFFLNHKGQYADPALAGIEPTTGANPGDIIAAIRTVLGRFKKGVAKEEKAAVENLMAQAKAKAKAGSTGAALDLFREVVRRGEGWQALEKAVDAAREGIETVTQEGMKKVRSAIARKAARADTRKALKALMAAYPDTDAADWARRLLAKLGK